MIKCIIIEDQPPAQRILQKYIENTDGLELKATFADAIQALTFLKENSIQLIFLDIHLPKISGLDFLKTIPNHPHVILTTAFPDYALESYEYGVVDYLLKPFSFERFVKAIGKVPHKKTASGSTPTQPQLQSQEALFIKSGHEHLRITPQSIHYIKSDADYTQLFLEEDMQISTHPLHYWLKTLPQHTFLRPHKSFIVNTSKIEKISGNQIFLRNGAKIPIGRAFKENFMEHIIV